MKVEIKKLGKFHVIADDERLGRDGKVRDRNGRVVASLPGAIDQQRFEQWRMDGLVVEPKRRRKAKKESD